MIFLEVYRGGPQSCLSGRTALGFTTAPQFCYTEYMEVMLRLNIFAQCLCSMVFSRFVSIDAWIRGRFFPSSKTFAWCLSHYVTAEFAFFNRESRYHLGAQ